MPSTMPRTIVSMMFSTLLGYLSMSPSNDSGTPVVLVTGAAKRVGAAIARALHASGWNVAIHYRASGGEARALEKELNRSRADSAASLRANLLDLRAVDKLAAEAHARWGRLDALVNNASS